jgi:hypothetical protein
MAGLSLPLPACNGLPVRDEPPTSLEYTAAELWIRERYGNYFTHSRPSPVLITWQLERLLFSYDNLHDDVLELVMTALERDFRNPLLPRLVANFRRLEQSGASADALRALLQEITPGGNLKPDMLGLCAGGAAIEMDAVEVGTVKTAQSTYDELQHKLGVLRDVIVPQLKIQLPQLSSQTQQSVPTEVTVAASSWRPAQWERVLPLPVRVTPAGGITYVDWICYHPTMTWYPRDSTASSTQSGSEGTDGLVIYHIHRLSGSLAEAPSRVKLEVRDAIRRWQEKKGLALSLDPSFATAVRADREAFDPAAKQLLAYLGAGALLLIVLGVAWEVGLVVGAEQAAQGGLTALAGSVEELAPLLRNCATLADQLWPDVSAAAGVMAKP